MEKDSWFRVFGGLCALFIGIGLCRFAYTPLLPYLVQQGWTSKSGAAYLAATNLIGYLFGAFLGQRATKFFKPEMLIKSSLLISVISFGMCSINWGFTWLGIWRLMAGATGAFLMVLTPSTVLKTIFISYRGRASGVIFTGIGFGIIVSGFLVPALASFDVTIAWVGITLLALIAMFIAWPVFTNCASLSNQHIQNGQSTVPMERPHINRYRNTLTLLTIAYLCYGIGMVPHTLFLVDYIHRKLELNLITSGMFWSIFGIGATVGPFCVGFIADKIGVYKSLTASYFLACAAISMVVFSRIIPFYVLSSFLMGVVLTSIPMLLSSRIFEIVDVTLHPISWGKVTLYCAISQAAAAYFMSYLLHHGVHYTVCFFAANLVFLFGLIAVAFSADQILTAHMDDQVESMAIPTVAQRELL
jgi:predicted MFS family arabinose efflux permease